MTSKFGVRCCSENDCTTSFSCNAEEGLTYMEAVEHCEREGRSVCTREQILSEMCCGTGGNCDNKPVWTSDLKGKPHFKSLNFFNFKIFRALIFSVLQIDPGCIPSAS